MQALIVGVGVSAGGIEALLAVLRALRPGRGLALLVVINQNPLMRSPLPDLAAPARLPVVEAADEQPVAPDHVYLCPPGRVLSLERGVLRLLPMENLADRWTPIDRTFHAIAHEAHGASAGVILSGEGSDGALGLKAISDAGGVTFVQDPSSAQHDAMPQSAIATGAADHVLAPDAIGAELMAYAAHVHEAGYESGELHQQVENVLPAVCEILLESSGHNFKHYKTSTLVRRVLRRVQVLRLPSAQAYVERLRTNRSEAEHLFNDLLIGVTAFFRDPEAFERLALEVLPRLFVRRAVDAPVRLWCAGCATGEEAYTLAMLVREHLDQLQAPLPEVQIFATDIDETALTAARQGAYPLGIAEEVGPERLKRFFVKKGQHYHITKELRELVLFSVHNVINDPPFSRLDLISCRNVLIYLGAHLQKKLIPLFHYALRPGGYLFLGPSENLSSHRELFRPIDARHRISQRLPTAIRSPGLLGGRSGPVTLARAASAPAAAENDTYLLMQRIILDEFAPKAVVVNEDGQVVSASGNLEKFLAVSAGTFHNSLVRLAREGLRVGVRAAFTEAAKVRRKVVNDGLSLRTEAGVQRVMVTVQPMPQMGEDGGLFLVVFQEVGPPISADGSERAAPQEDAAALVEQLERELSTTRSDLERTVQDLEAANEELKSGNEELLSMNEELQSANEELETSKEEVQSANDSLARVNTDLENLLASTQIATLFLDREGCIRRVTPAAASVYRVRPDDAGRPLEDITHKARAMPPMPSFVAVRDAAGPIEDAVELIDGTPLLRRVLPYRNREGSPEGVVVTFTDVTGPRQVQEALAQQTRVLDAALEDRKRAEAGLRYQLELTRSVMDNATTSIFVTDMQGRGTFANRAAEVLTGFAAEELIGHVLHDRVHHTRPDGTPYPAHECVLQGTLPLRRELRGHEDALVRKDGTLCPVLCSARVVLQDGAPAGMVIEAVDTTARRRAEQVAREAAERTAALLESVTDGFMALDREWRYTYVNQEAERVLGRRPGDLIGKVLWTEYPEILGTAFERAYRRAAEERVSATVTDYYPEHGRHYEVHAYPAPDGVSVFLRDVTEQRRTEEALREEDRRKTEFLATLAHELRNPLAPIGNVMAILRMLPAEQLVERREKLVGMLDRQVAQLVHLVDDLLDISRIATGKIQLRPEVLDLRDVVHAALETTGAGIAAARHQLLVELPPAPLPVEGDRTRLTQVLTNILNNACKYTPEGGVIKLLASAAEGAALVRVSDSGVGIPREMLPKVFEVFTQVNRSLDRSQGGLGLGLALVKRVVTLHGGQVWAESQGPGNGTTFVVQLALRPPASGPVRAAERR